MTNITGGITATLLGSPDRDLGRVEGSGVLDESWSPHVQAELTLAMPDEATLAQLDPRQHRRVRIDASTVYPGTFIPSQERSFNLGLRDRVIDHEAGEVKITLESDEGLVMDDVLLSSTALDFWTSQTSLRSIVNSVLARIGGTLQPGPDANMTPYWDVTNLIPNPRPGSNATDWQIGFNGTFTGSITMVSPIPPHGPYAVKWTATAAGTSTLAAGTPSTFRVQPGRWYVWTFYLASGASTSARAALQWRSRGGVGTLATVYGSTVTSVTSEFRRLHVIAQAPEGADSVWPFIDTAGNGAGREHFAASGMLYAGKRLIPYFDGSWTDTADYLYDWADPDKPNDAASTRRALIPSDPESLEWQPGVAGWDFLKPLFQRAGLRLFCDEQRNWWLVDGATYFAPGTTQLVMPGSLHTAVDTTDRDGDWFDAALARYRWVDASGMNREKIDYHAPPGYTKARVFEFDNTPYPGPGFAQYAVKRAEGLGRTIELEALTDLSVSASQALNVTLPDTPALAGVVRSVRFDLVTGQMLIRSRGITDILDGAIDLMTGTIDALAGTIDAL